MNVYLVRQESSHLYGDVLDSAVIIAESVKSACSMLNRYLRNSEMEIMWDDSLWAVTRLGHGAKRPPAPYSSIVCTHMCSKDSLPPGNYMMRKP